MNSKTMYIRNKTLACPFCSSQHTKHYTFIPKISICQDCELAFNLVDKEVDYSNETDFASDPKKISEWRRFAIRDYKLIVEHLRSLNIKQPNILEIGSGYGLMSEYIQENLPMGKYYHLEINLSLKNELRKRNQLTIDSIDEIEHADIVILSHVLEHIQNAKVFLENLMNRFPEAQIILFQSNYKGIIPKYFPWLWYGWSLDQHFYHFTQKSLTFFFAKYNYRVSMQIYYKLDQVFSFTLKGMIKGILYIINLFVHGASSDAFVIGFKK